MATPIVLTMEGTLLNWLKQPGEAVKAGEVVAEVEADKATVEVTAPADGVIASISAEVGQELSEGAVLGQIGAAGEAVAEPTGKSATAPSQSAPPPAPAQAAPSGNAPSGNGVVSNGTVGNGAVASTTPEGRVKASPVARNLASDKGVDLAQVRGTGPGGRIVKADVENFQPGISISVQPSAAPAGQQVVTQGDGIAIVRLRPTPQASEDIELIDVTRMRKTIAAGTTESAQQIPHFTVTVEMDLQPLMDLRKQLNSSLEDTGVKVSVNDMIVKAAALALREFPNLNTHFYGDKVARYKHINVGIAVAPPNGGVIYVVAKDADKVSLSTLAQTNKEMIDRARELKLKPDDTKGATFSTSNLGPYDVEHFAAIINPPEAAVLAIGSGRNIPVVKSDGTLGVGLRIKMTVSVDHRVSDGAEGAAFLQKVRQLIENPMRLLV